MKCDRGHLALYAVTDRTWLGEQTLAMQVEEALKGGATCIQLREKALDDQAFLAEAVEIKALCKKYSVPFLINDNVELAVQCGADGIHVGQHDMEAGSVREKVGPGMILGVSAQTVEQAVFAEKSGADYLGVGAVFSTATKPDADAVSREMLAAICRAVSIPVVAIGGIDRYNILELKDTGIAGVALVSALFAQKDIRGETEKLRLLAERIRTQ